MGTWGTNISDNDLYKDLEYEFFNHYNEGIQVEIITNKLIEKYNESLEADEDSNDFWLAIADLQWQCKALDEEVLKKVEFIIKSGLDLKLWEELDSSKADIKARERNLNKFLIKISTTKKSAKRIKKKILLNSIYKKGDCLIFKLDNGKYGGALVLEEENYTELGWNLIVVSDLEETLKPTVKDLKKAGIRFFNDGNLYEEHYSPYTCYLSARYFEDDSKNLEIEVIGNLTLKNRKVKGNCWISWRALNRSQFPQSDQKITGRLKISDFLNFSLLFMVKNWL